MLLSPQEETFPPQKNILPTRKNILPTGKNFFPTGRNILRNEQDHFPGADEIEFVGRIVIKFPFGFID